MIDALQKAKQVLLGSLRRDAAGVGDDKNRGGREIDVLGTEYARTSVSAQVDSDWWESWTGLLERADKRRHMTIRLGMVISLLVFILSLALACLISEPATPLQIGGPASVGLVGVAASVKLMVVCVKEGKV